MENVNEALLKGLTSLGCRVENSHGTTYVTMPDNYAEFIFEPYEACSYLGTSFLAPEELAQSEYQSVLDRFLLELQDRNLGCNFAYDQAGFLAIGTQLSPDMQTPDRILEAMEQIAYVIDASLPLCDRVLASGEVPSDREVDTAFGITDTLH